MDLHLNRTHEVVVKFLQKKTSKYVFTTQVLTYFKNINWKIKWAKFSTKLISLYYQIYKGNQTFKNLKQTLPFWLNWNSFGSGLDFQFFLNSRIYTEPGFMRTSAVLTKICSVRCFSLVPIDKTSECPSSECSCDYRPSFFSFYYPTKILDFTPKLKTLTCSLFVCFDLSTSNGAAV